jgi:hypothetical protein
MCEHSHQVSARTDSKCGRLAMGLGWPCSPWARFWRQWFGLKTTGAICQWFGPKTTGTICQWFSLKTTGMVFSGLGLKTDLIKSVEALLYPYIRIPMVEFTHTTLFLYFSTYKGSSLVVEAQAKPCWESRVKSNLCSSSRSSLGDQWALVSLPFFIDFDS